jgi:hypothetical protein
MSAPSELTSPALSLSYSSSSVIAPGSDLTGSIYTRSRFRFGLTPAALNDPPHTELSVFVNGCSIGKINDVGEEYFWTSQATDMDQRVESGRFVVVEVVRAGQGVVVRRSFAMPAQMPRLTAPAAHAAISAPITLSWAPLGLANVAGATSATLRATGWIINGGSGQTDGFLTLNDASGQATWNAGKSTWTSIDITATIDYGPSGLTFYLGFHEPVN